MQLIDLPEEVLIIIIRKLDVCSLRNLYNASNIFRMIVRLPGVVKQCCISRNTMATVKTLQLNFFKDISYSLSVLNMSGIPNLNKTAVLPAMRLLKNLKVLDISYTHLDVIDFIHIHNVCPTIKDITVNFLCSSAGHRTMQHVLECQSVFKHLVNINFVGSLLNLLNSYVALYHLKRAKLNHLKLTVAGLRHTRNCKSPDDDQASCAFVKMPTLTCIESNEYQLPEFDQLTIFIMNWQRRSTLFVPSKSFGNLPAFEKFEWKKHEYVILCIDKLDPKVYASPMFSSFFQETFHITTQCLVQPFDAMLQLNMAILIWNKAAVKFDNNFYCTLTKQLKPYFPYYFESQNELQELSAPTVCNWFYTIPSVTVQNNQKNYVTDRGTSKNRIAAPTFLLNYDKLKGKKNLKLSLLFQDNASAVVSLNANCLYMKNLTYFSLIQLGRYNFNFFHILFFHCENLVTLNVEVSSATTCASAIARTLSISLTLKNLRIVDKNIEFSSLFTSFSLCPRLEIVHIVDASTIQNELADPSVLVEKSNQLYSICIEATITSSAKVKTLQLFNKAKGKFNRNYINVSLKRYGLNEHIYDGGNYDLFVDVFRLNPIRPVSVKY